MSGGVKSWSGGDGECGLLASRGEYHGVRPHGKEVVENTMGSDPMVKKSFIFEMPSGVGARKA